MSSRFPACSGVPAITRKGGGVSGGSESSGLFVCQVAVLRCRIPRC
jgi:hypothetical protein